MFVLIGSNATPSAAFGFFVLLSILVSLITYSPFYSSNLFKQKYRVSIIPKALWLAAWPAIAFGLYSTWLRFFQSYASERNEIFWDRSFVYIFISMIWTVLTYGLLMTFTYQTPLGPKVEEMIEKSKEKNGVDPRGEVRL
jgi:hypothetical protein